MELLYSDCPLRPPAIFYLLINAEKDENEMHLLIKILILKYFFAVAVAVSKSLAGTSRKFGSKYRRFESHQCFHITYNFSFWMKRIISRSIPTGPKHTLTTVGVQRATILPKFHKLLSF